MTQEEKQLLLKDLCGRLPYGALVFIRKPFGCVMSETEEEELTATTLQEFIENDEMHVFPYLRPMSSMTDDEREDWYRQSKVDYDCEFKPEPTLSLEHCHLSVDWLNKYGFDYRGLIPMGLALESPEGTYD